MSRLLTNRTKHHGSMYYCNYCLHGFSRKDLLDQHVPYCKPFGPQRIEMPRDKYLKFTNIAHQLPVPFIIYADFECFTEPIHSCKPDTESYTHDYQRHTPSGYCYYVVSPYFDTKPVLYRGPNVVDHFLTALQEEENIINNILENPTPMIFTKDDEKLFESATNCHICGHPLDQNRVRDHDHISGFYRGAAHNKCNLDYRFRRGKGFFIPVVFHNLRGYDSHLMIPALGRHSGRINCIPNNMEKFMSFSLGQLRFIDSLQFMNMSLEKLVRNLDTFTHLEKHTTHAHLLKRKGVFPYDYCNRPEVFEAQQLPPIQLFYSTLHNNNISDEDYQHALNVWKTFGITNFGEYHDLYLKTDVLLLADVFERFRHTCLEYYGLDPAHYYTSPGLSWNAMLKMTDVKLELFSDLDMHLFVEKGLRGGVSMISNKYAKANNKYVDGFDFNKPSKYIMYLDANNLYGTVMSQHLPLSDFKWLSQDEIARMDFKLDDVGYILEVDLDYPEHLHDLHSDYPLAPENIEITADMLSAHTKTLRDVTSSMKKLTPNLYGKKNYVIHYRNLLQCLEHGLILTKIHRVIQFTQSPWLKPYIDFNTEKRMNANNSFEKDFFKLMNNSVFGKTMENLRKRVNVHLISDEKKIKKYVAKPQYHACKIFDSVVAVHLRRTKLVLNRPIYVGFTILDLSKIIMYDFHYNYITNKYHEAARLLFTDTDSLCYEITTDDVYSDMQADSHLFDFSDYPQTHPNYSPTNKKVLGKFKDETVGYPILEFVGLKPKMYSIVTEDDHKRTAKGIYKSNLTHEMYKECLFSGNTTTCNNNVIRSRNQELFTQTIRKIGLSSYDDKRYVLQNYSTRAIGHYLNN